MIFISLPKQRSPSHRPPRAQRRPSGQRKEARPVTESLKCPMRPGTPTNRSVGPRANRESIYGRKARRRIENTTPNEHPLRTRATRQRRVWCAVQKVAAARTVATCPTHLSSATGLRTSGSPGLRRDAPMVSALSHWTGRFAFERAGKQWPARADKGSRRSRAFCLSPKHCRRSGASRSRDLAFTSHSVCNMWCENGTHALETAGRSSQGKVGGSRALRS
jgi:hypothetical protein